jgi:hypothetical protein
MWVPHPSAFFAEGWDTTNLGRRIGFYNSFVMAKLVSYPAGWRTLISWNLILPTFVGRLTIKRLRAHHPAKDESRTDAQGGEPRIYLHGNIPASDEFLRDGLVQNLPDS